MVTKISDLSDKDLRIGDIFTPLEWGEFAVEKFGLYEKWLNGATVFDPTMGEGNLLEALIRVGLADGKSLDELPTSNLFGNELNTNHFNSAIGKFESRYGLDMRANFSNEDFLVLNTREFDIVFGNPPWQNFVDLPDDYKEKIKSHFFKYDLVSNSQSLLLGGSRIDIAALIIQKAIQEFLRKDGEAVIFMPLSLLLNDGANRGFRTYSVDRTKYSIEIVYDFNDTDVFGGVATRYGLTYFRRDKLASFPIPYLIMKQGVWTDFYAKPIFHPTDPLSIVEKSEVASFENFEPIRIRKESSPRQGVNTCGANEIFFFDTCLDLDDETVLLSNKEHKEIPLPKRYVYPLITSKEFKSFESNPSKWVLLPYNSSGKPLDSRQLETFPLLKNYLMNHKEALENRKGTMLNATLSRGSWWALLGVGEYNFFPYKIVWEAYGKSSFEPRIFEGKWQANQSLQAFIPVKSKEEAERVLKALSRKSVENYLLSLKMEGTMNWAQPGKIKKLIQYEEETLSLFS